MLVGRPRLRIPASRLVGRWHRRRFRAMPVMSGGWVRWRSLSGWVRRCRRWRWLPRIRPGPRGRRDQVRMLRPHRRHPHRQRLRRRRRWVRVRGGARRPTVRGPLMIRRPTPRLGSVPVVPLRWLRPLLIRARPGCVIVARVLWRRRESMRRGSARIPVCRRRRRPMTWPVLWSLIRSMRSQQVGGQVHRLRRRRPRRWHR